MKNTSNNNGAEFVLFTVTRAAQVDDTLFAELEKYHPHLSVSYDILDNRLTAFAENEDIDFLSSLSVMRELQASGKPAHLHCDGHWTRDAHNQAAEVLANYLITGEYI